MDWKKPNCLPSLGFMYDRWPRYVLAETAVTEISEPILCSGERKKKKDHIGTQDKPHSDPTSNLDSTKAMIEATQVPSSIQYFCSGGAVVQRYLLNFGDGGASCELVEPARIQLTSHVRIKNLDSTDERKTLQEQNAVVLSDNTIVTTTRLPGELTEHHAAALIVSAFIDNEPAKIADGAYLDLSAIKSKTQVAITMTYKLEILSHQAVHALKSEGSFDRDIVSPMPDSYSNLPGVGTSDLITHSVTTASRGVTDNDAEQKHEGSIESLSYLAFRSVEEMDSVFCTAESSSFRKVPFSRNPYLDFAFRRNLEHILSVRCIPIPVPNDGHDLLEGNAFAITCGDIADHRIEPRADL